MKDAIITVVGISAIISLCAFFFYRCWEVAHGDYGKGPGF